jgi:mannose PTS system EIIA component
VINFLVITHGEFGAYLIEAAEAIVGVQSEGVRALSISPRHSVDEIRSRIAAEVAELSAGGGLVVAVDMPGGTPANVSVPLAKDDPRVRVVSGVNLYMLVGAFSHRAERSLDDCARHMTEDGRRSVLDLKAWLAGRSAAKGNGA